MKIVVFLEGRDFWPVKGMTEELEVDGGLVYDHQQSKDEPPGQ